MKKKAISIYVTPFFKVRRCYNVS